MGTILGIESSCDDTSAAIYQNGKILANLIANQEIHEQHGGVVPELASRAHLKNIVPVVKSCLEQADVPMSALDAIAVTRGPGLMGSLIVGTCFAKAMSQSLAIPLIEVNHMKAHVLAHFIDDPKPSFPFICLTVSGGHTQLVLVNDYDDMEVIGHTIDDAAGEAFDKIAKMLGLTYPGGPLVDKLAQSGDPNRFDFPYPKVQGYGFSFSGLKTSMLYFLKREKEANPNFVEENLNDICASIQRRIVTILISKLKKAADHYKIKEVAIAGGVSANSELRKALIEMGEKRRWNTYIPKFEYCTDNAAMIAIAGYHKYLKQEFASLAIKPDPRLKITI